MAVASHEDIVKALGLWSAAQLGKTPEEWGGFVSKYGIEDPFVPWPPEEDKIKEFLKKFQERILTNVEAPISIAGSVDAKKIEELVGEFDREYAKTKNADAAAEERAKKHVQEIIRHTVEKPDVAPEQKRLLSQVLKSQIEQHPGKTIQEIMPEAEEICERAQPFITPEAFNNANINPRFADLKGLTKVQKAVAAPFWDAATTVFPELRQGVINKNIEDGLRKILDLPGKIPNKALLDLFGQKVVDSPLFKQMLADAKRSMPTQGAPRSSAVNILGDVTSSLFRKAPGEVFIAYWEVYQYNRAHNLPIPTLYSFQLKASATGAGSQIFHFGTNYLLSRTKGAAFKWGVTKAGLAKLGLEAVVPGGGWAAAALTVGGGLFGKLFGWLTGRTLKSSEVPGDKWVFGVICIAIFLPIILFVVSQLNIDSALVGRLQLVGGGTSADNQLFIISITATPESVNGDTIVSMRYTITIQPKGSPGSFTINAINIAFSVYGGSGSPGLDAPTITPDMLSDGTFSFVLPFGPQLNDSVVTGTVNANVSIGANAGVNGSASVSTVIGNPSIDCFVFGGAGVRDNYGHVSSDWDNKSGMLSAIGVLAQSPQYMSRVCPEGSPPVTIYRVKADFGGGSAMPPNSIFIYNVCVTSCSTYTLAHETGHIVDSRTSLFNEYNSQALYAREGPLWTYPNAFSEHEDFAETLGAYVVWHSYTWGARHDHSAGSLNYSGEYPLHYQFAKSVFGIEY